MKRVCEMKKYYIVLMILGSLLIGGCTQGAKSEKVGYLITPSKNDIYYKCGNKEANLKENGKFICQSFPVAFYLDDYEIGVINSLHKDGYVFPQDMESVTLASR
jgi:hypothetical protein